MIMFMFRLKFWNKRRGQALVEFGLVLPILVIVMVAILEMGFVVRDYMTVNYILSNAVKEASLMRGVSSGDIHVVKTILEETYGLDPNKLLIVSPTGNRYGPYTLVGDSVLGTGSVQITSFPEPMFFYDDMGTPNDTSDDIPVSSSNLNADYVRVTISYIHQNLGAYPEFMSLNNITITESKRAVLE